ncbi:MAG: hypothetical protein JXQ83_04630, partial [Candidatus Glassbacteria bacterium]|nr:hypothetical protein [Candidatus Glassbacteria bacterium]
MSAEPLASLTALISVIFALLTSGCAGEHFAVSADGVRIAYQVQGRGEPALVFVHGWCCDKSY